MGKTKAKTLIERFGFKDTELTTPEHDDIFCWLFTKNNILKMLYTLDVFSFKNETRLNKMCYSDVNQSQCDWSVYTKNCTGNCHNNEDTKKSIATWAKQNYNFCSTRPITQAINIFGEYAVLSGNYNIGFIDAKIEISIGIKPKGQDERYCTFSRIISDYSQVYYVEIKPKVQSLGELLRQINLYRSHVGNGKWIILTDEIKDEFETILKDQDIFVYNRTKYCDNQPVNKPISESFFDRKGS